MPELFQNVPWGHHIDIICRSTTLDEALFYAKHTIQANLLILNNKIKIGVICIFLHNKF